MLRGFLVTSFALLLSGGFAAAQSPPRVADISPGAPPKGELRVQVSVSFFVPGEVDGSNASLKAQEDARRMLYKSAARECDVLREAIASECKLEQVSVNVNRMYGAPQSQGFNATGNFSFRVVPK